MALNMTKIAFGCDELAQLSARLEGRAAGGRVTITTRYRPRRADEMVGGSLYWIVRHRLVARSAILAFGEADGRCAITLGLPLVAVRSTPKRAHQGWRYLEADAAPDDLAGADDPAGALPPAMLSELTRLGLV